MLRWFRNRKASPPKRLPAIPTVKFDPDRVSKAVEDDLRQIIGLLDTLPQGSHKTVFKATIASLKAGFDLKSLTDVLIQTGVGRKEAAVIARHLQRRAQSIMDVERSLELGIMEGTWQHSGAPCIERSLRASGDELRDAQHKAASGTKFLLADGLLIEGRYCHPGRDCGCKCYYKPVLPFDI